MTRLTLSALAAAALLFTGVAGCEREVATEREVEVRDGEVREETTRVTETPDGDIRVRETETTERIDR